MQKNLKLPAAGAENAGGGRAAVIYLCCSAAGTFSAVPTPRHRRRDLSMSGLLLCPLCQTWQSLEFFI